MVPGAVRQLCEPVHGLYELHPAECVTATDAGDAMARHDAQLYARTGRTAERRIYSSRWKFGRRGRAGRTTAAATGGWTTSTSIPDVGP